MPLLASVWPPRKTPGHEACSGCSLCLLGCPVWRQRRDIRLTPQGRAKALQHGAGVAQIAASVDSCTLCGSCEPACPENIPLVDMILGLRRQKPLEAGKVAAIMQAALDGAPVGAAQVAGATLLLAGASLRAHPQRLERALALLQATPADDDGDDIGLAIEAGVPVLQTRLSRFLESLRAAKCVVVSEGGLLRWLRTRLPQARIIGLGEALSSLPVLRSRLRTDDLYVIEPRAFHQDYQRLIGHYDRLRAEFGLAMNLDLQRFAVATTSSSAQHALGLPAIDVSDQARWIMEGRAVGRVVVEDPRDCEAFARITDRPVLHLADLQEH